MGNDVFDCILQCVYRYIATRVVYVCMYVCMYVCGSDNFLGKHHKKRVGRVDESRELNSFYKLDKLIKDKKVLLLTRVMDLFVIACRVSPLSLSLIHISEPTRPY